MKICFVTEHYPPHVGGVETAFYEYATRLRDRGHIVTVVTSTSSGITTNTIEGSYRVYRYPSWTVAGHPYFLSRHLAPHIAAADLVHTTTYTAALPALRVARRQHKPCLLTVHEVLGKRWFAIEANYIAATLYYLAERYITTRSYTHWHAVSQATAGDLRAHGIEADKITVIYHGIDASRWHNQVVPANLSALFHLPPTARIILYSGRLGKTKGVPHLLQAIQQINQALPSDIYFGFIVPATTDDGKRFRQTIEKLQLQSRVRITNFVAEADLPAYRKAAYAAIVPSLTEGFGFTAAENASLGIPQVVSDAGSLPEVVSGQAVLYTAGDSHNLAQALARTIRGEFQKYPPRHFSWDHTIDKLTDLYETILAHRRHL